PDTRHKTWKSKGARKKAEQAYANDLLATSRQRLTESQQVTPAETQQRRNEGLPLGTRVLITFTATVVLVVSAVIALVIIGTQIGFYRSEMVVQEVDLSKLGISRSLDLPTFTPVATEEVVWACTLLAVVLVLLNRPSRMWTRAMWFFASIAALVNTWHSITSEEDVLGGIVKGGLSIAGPFIVHLFILWVRHVRTGKTLVQARTDMATRWRTVGRFLLTVLGVFADHLTHPRVSVRAFSLWRLYRGSSYATAWKLAVVESRERSRERSREHRNRSAERSEDRSANDGEHSGEHSEWFEERSNSTQVNTLAHGDERSDEQVNEHPSEHLMGPFTEQDRSLLLDYERTEAELFARLEAEMAALADSVQEECSHGLNWGERSNEQSGDAQSERLGDTPAN